MKSSMKLITVAAVLIMAALIASPVAARGASIKTILSGDHIFVYEVGLDITNLNATAVSGVASVPPTSLRKFVDDDVTKALIKEIPISNPASFDVLSGLVGDQTGLYFAYNASSTYPGAEKAANKSSVSIVKSDLGLGVYLNVTSGLHVDSIDGKSITRFNNITFKISAPNLGTYYRNGTGVAQGQVDVRITTPDGGQITVFGYNNVNLGRINVTSAEFYTDSPPQGGLDAIMLNEVTAGTYTAVLKFASGQDFYKQTGTDSNAVSFTVLSKPITLTTTKESVVRGNNFAVTITGESNKWYWLYVKKASITADKMPLVQGWEVNAQPGTNNTKGGGAAGTGIIYVSTGNPKNICTVAASDLDGCPTLATDGIYAGVLTQADGTRAVMFNTSSATEDKKYTIKAIDPLDSSKYDQVDVTVEKGKVTITYEGTGSYYLGETIKLSGTNTDSKKVFLFVKGPNLGDAGRSLTNLSQAASKTDTPTGSGTCPGMPADGTNCWKVVDVNTDNTWSFKWDTSKLVPAGAFSLDAGTYTIYATATAADGTSEGLSNPERIYETASIVLKKPFVTASASTNTLAKGDKLYIRGTAEGKPNNVYIWIFGKNYRSCANGESVKSDATYEWKYDRADTSSLYAGQYFVVVQHPMMNGAPDVVGTTDALGYRVQDGPTCQYASGNQSLSAWTSGAPVVKLTGLQASDAATALVELLNSPNVDDTYTKLSFMIEEPWIRIDTIGDKYVGDTFKITGTTNLAEGDTILMTVTSSSFQPTEKTQTGEFSGASGSVTVQKGDTYNTFSFDVDASTFKPDEYLVKAEAVEPSQTTTATFNVLEGKPTTVATTAAQTPVVTTAVQTPVQTVATTAVPVTTAKPQPGFGALVALVGLGAVALLVLRRR